MQYEIELNNSLPNQTFTTNITGVDMEITLKMAGDSNNPIMLFALQINNEYICPYIPVFANQGVLPYEYLISEVGGQFFMETENDETPYWENFGSTCRFYFVTLDELNG